MADYETAAYRKVRRYDLEAVRRGMVVTCSLCGFPITLGGRMPGEGARGRVGAGRGGGALQVDHRVPRAEGGSLTDPSNMAPAHAICNQRKGQATMIQRQRRKPSARRLRYRSSKFARKISREKN